MDTSAVQKQIQNYVILKAWRHQRERNQKLEADAKILANQVENLQLQIYTLKHLLDTEKTRVVHFNADLRKILTTLEECKHEKHTLVKEKEQLETRVRLLEEKLVEMEMEYKNQKNELLTARNEAQNWEKQLEKEREKLSKMKDERKFFVEEVRFKGNLLVWQIRSYDQFSRFFNVLQRNPNNPALPWDESFGRIEPMPEIFKKEKSPKRQPIVAILEKPHENPESKLLRVNPERKILEEDERNEELEKSILGKTSKETGRKKPRDKSLSITKRTDIRERIRVTSLMKRNKQIMDYHRNKKIEKISKSDPNFASVRQQLKLD